MQSLYDFRYIFDDKARTLSVQILCETPGDSENIIAMIEVDGTNAMALAVASPVYSSSINAIPSVYDEEFGVCNLLDESIPQITCTTKFEDVNRLSLKLVSADSNVTGNVVLAFQCGEVSWEETITVTDKESWIELTPENRLTGTMVITRVYGSSFDTLKNDDLVISLCITNIKAEVI